MDSLTQLIWVSLTIASVWWILGRCQSKCTSKILAPFSTSIRHNSLPKTDLPQDDNHSTSNVWTRVLNHTPFLTTTPLPKSRLYKSLVKRDHALTVLQGYVKIGDLIQHPDLEKSITGLVSHETSFTMKTLRLESSYQSTLTQLSSFIQTFCTDFSYFLSRAEHQLCRDPNDLSHRTQHGESSKARLERESLTSTLRDLKMSTSITAAGIRQAIAMLRHELTSLSPTATTTETRLPPASNPVSNTPNHRRFTTTATTLLSELNTLPQTHALHGTLHATLSSLMHTKPEHDVGVARMRDDFVTVDALLAQLTDILAGLDVDAGLGAKAGEAVRVMGRLGAVVRLSQASWMCSALR